MLTWWVFITSVSNIRCSVSVNVVKVSFDFSLNVSFRFASVAYQANFVEPRCSRAKLPTATTRSVSDIISNQNYNKIQQPDLSINWTVAHVMLVIGQYASFCARC